MLPPTSRSFVDLPFSNPSASGVRVSSRPPLSTSRNAAASDVRLVFFACPSLIVQRDTRGAGACKRRAQAARAHLCRVPGHPGGCCSLPTPPTAPRSPQNVFDHAPRKTKPRPLTFDLRSLAGPIPDQHRSRGRFLGFRRRQVPFGHVIHVSEHLLQKRWPRAGMLRGVRMSPSASGRRADTCAAGATRVRAT